MNRRGLSRRNLIAGSTGAAVTAISIAGTAPQKAQAAAPTTRPRESISDPVERPGGLDYLEAFKSSGLV